MLTEVIQAERGNLPRQTEDEFLRNGLKYMLALTTSVLTEASLFSTEEWVDIEELIVDKFIDGLRANGYDIVKKETLDS